MLLEVLLFFIPNYLGSHIEKLNSYVDDVTFSIQLPQSNSNEIQSGNGGQF